MCYPSDQCLRRIRDNEYEFPADRAVSGEVQDLVQAILTPNPQERPTLHQIVDHDFFANGIVPGYIPTSAHDAPPDFRHISRQVSNANLARLRKYALLDEEVTPLAVPSAPPAVPSESASAPKNKGVTSTLAQQEKEFLKAVQPGSPISALLSSARQPLLVAPGTTRGEQPLLRKLQAAREAKSPGRPGRDPRLGNLQNIEEEQGAAAAVAYETKQEDQRRKELESQKARIVAQMVPGSSASSTNPMDEQENIRPAERASSHRDRAVEKASLKGKGKELPPQPAATAAVSEVPSGLPPLRINGFDVVAETLTAALDARAVGRLFRDPRADADLQHPKVFIMSWLDYANKYGMGYATTDGSVGVHFNDSTSLILSPDKSCVPCLVFAAVILIHCLAVILTTLLPGDKASCTCARTTRLPNIPTRSRTRCIS